MIHLGVFLGVILAVWGCLRCMSGYAPGPSSSVPKTNLAPIYILWGGIILALLSVIAENWVGK